MIALASPLPRTLFRISCLVAAIALLGAVALCSPLVAGVLECWAASSARDTSRAERGAYDVAIVLGGADEQARIAAAIRPLQRGQALYLLISGERNPNAEKYLLKELRALGIPSDRIVFETRSRTTWENAVQSARIVSARGWRSLLLVTSADHMARASGCFHRLGLWPDTLPVARSDELMTHRPLVSRAAARISVQALHELWGRVAYRVLGYSS
jgi:uncharacterized SAM-binding protein YcdF (DUF218 family)